MLVPAYRCSHSGKYYPADYIKEWGRKYGIGMGPEPVSECLDTDYNMPLAVPDRGGMENAMHPVGFTHGQVDFVMVEEAEYNANRLITQLEDPYMEKRAQVLRNNQLRNSRSKLAGLLAMQKEQG